VLKTEELRQEITKTWYRHRAAVTTVPERHRVCRGAAALAMVLAEPAGDWPQVGDRLLVPDADVQWASLIDVPSGFLEFDGELPPAHWAAVRPTMLRHGMPVIASARGEVGWDLRRQAPDGLSAQILGTMMAMECGLTQWATVYRPGWMKSKRVYDEKLFECPLAPKAPQQANKIPVYPRQWMPRPWLGFAEQDVASGSLYGQATEQHLVGATVMTVPEGMRAGFIDDFARGFPVTSPIAGQLVAVQSGARITSFHIRGKAPGEDCRLSTRSAAKVLRQTGTFVTAGMLLAQEEITVPRDWAEQTRDRQWQFVLSRLAGNIATTLHDWFYRQGVRLSPGLVHFPSQYTSRVPYSGARRGEVYWAIDKDLPYYQDAVHAMIFPPLPVERWDDLRGFLPGDVAYDLMPQTARFRVV
jgi:hypothetical protein